MPDGSTVILHIVSSRLLLLLPCQHDLIDELKLMKLSDQKGEHVPRFNHKIMTKCKEITQVGPAPRDLSNLAVKCHLQTQVVEFRSEMLKIHQVLQRNPEAHSHNTVVKHAL